MDLGAVALSASNAAVVGTGVGYSDASYALDVQYNVHIGCCCVCRCYVCFWPLQLLCIAALICEYTVITTLRAKI